MATTTNYGWVTPDDTSLVKDGAAAIRTLGSSVDTTTKNLNPQTTTGALAYRSSTSNVNTALPIGTANQILRVNSGATAPEWATVASGGMTSIATGSLSGASVSLSSISSSYIHLYLVLRNVYMAVNNGLIRATLNNDTGTSYASGPGYLGGYTGAAGDGYLTIADTLSSTNNKNTTNFEIFNYTVSDAYRQLARFSTREQTTVTQVAAESFGMVWFNKTTAVNRIDLLAYTNAGATTTFAGGTYTLYGVQ